MTEIDQLSTEIEMKGICFVCGEETPTADAPDICSSSLSYSPSSSSSCCSDSSVLCTTCLKAYLENLIGGGFHGYCPQIKCPAPHSKQDQHLIKFDKWKSLVDPEVLKKYSKMAESLLEILCGNCHNSRTTLVPAAELSEYEEISTSISKHFDTESSAHNIDSLLDDIAKYCLGRITADDLYTKLLQLFPMLNACTDESAWELMTKILSLLEDPERRATMQLRHFKGRPNMKTKCCSYSHCWNCKTKVHKGMTCDQFSEKMDHSIVPCPQCGVSLAKGDGCNSVSCFCGYNFDWSRQKKKVDGAAAFHQAYPDDTDRECMRILTQDQDSSSTQLASAWKAMHNIDVNKMLLEWWMRAYQHCPAQAAAVPDSEVSRFTGRKDARELYRQNNAQAVAKCAAENQNVISSFFISMFPDMNERSQMALLLTHSNDRRSKSRAFRSIPLLEQSARLWLQENPDQCKIALSQLIENQIRSVLYLFGNTDPAKFVNTSFEHELADSPFKVDISCSSLEYTDDNRTATRPGGSSCYPAAFVPVSSPNCQITFELTNCALSVNYMSFGLCRSGFPSSSSDGFGKTRDSWGICDNRNSSNENDHAWVGGNRDQDTTFRKFQEGDRIMLSLNVDQQLFEISVNDGEFRYEWEVPCDHYENFRFGCTFANDHSVTIVETDICPGGHDCWINSEQLSMVQTAVRSFRDLYNDGTSLRKSEYYRRLGESYEIKSKTSKENILKFYMQIEDAMDGKPFTFYSLKDIVFVQFELNLEDFFGLMSWMQCNKDVADEYINEKLALEHLSLHGEGSAFVAASIHYEQRKDERSKDYKAAVAYMKLFRDDINQWYDYNNELEDPIIPKHSGGCRCLPRCYKGCVNRPSKQKGQNKMESFQEPLGAQALPPWPLAPRRPPGEAYSHLNPFDDIFNNVRINTANLFRDSFDDEPAVDVLEDDAPAIITVSNLFASDLTDDVAAPRNRSNRSRNSNRNRRRRQAQREYISSQRATTT